MTEELGLLNFVESASELKARERPMYGGGGFTTTLAVSRERALQLNGPTAPFAHYSIKA